MNEQSSTPLLDEGLWRALQCRINRIKKAAPKLHSTSQAVAHDARRIILTQLHEVKILCKTYDIDFLQYLQNKDIILVARIDGKIDLHIA